MIITTRPNKNTTNKQKLYYNTYILQPESHRHPLYETVQDKFYILHYIYKYNYFLENSIIYPYDKLDVDI